MTASQPPESPAAQRVAERIRQADTLVIATHTAPDADAIGGVLGLALALRSIGKSAIAACSDELPSRFANWPGSATLVRQVDRPPDALIALDCGDRARLGAIGTAPDWHAVPLINIDHHVTNTRFGDINWIDPAATATCEMALELVDALGISLRPDIATNLLAGIVGDTLGFRTPHTTPRALALAARLMVAGASLFDVMDQQFNRRSFSMLRLWAKALSAMQLEPAAAPGYARVIWAPIPREMRRACGDGEWGNSGLSSFLASADEADVSAVLIEKDDGEIDISLRAKREFDVSGVALALGGGGHALAAGATIPGPLDVAAERVLAALKSIRRSSC